MSQQKEQSEKKDEIKYEYIKSDLNIFSSEYDPKKIFQSKLNVILEEINFKLEQIAEKVLSKEVLEQLKKNIENTGRIEKNI